MIKTLALKFLTSKLLKGKLTNLSALSTVVLPLLQAFGIDVVGSEWDAVIAGALALVTIAGKARAVFQAK